MSAAATFHPLRVSSLERDGNDAVLVTFAVPDELADEYRFRPGQHLTLRRTDDGEEIRRSYSICSPEGGPLRIGVRHLPGGRMSGFVHEHLAEGDVVEVGPPAGSFCPDGTTGLHHVAVSGGSGITPISGIVASVLAADADATVTLVAVDRGSATAMLVDDLAELKDRHPERLAIWRIGTREGHVLDLLAGRPDWSRLIGRGVLPADGDRYWLCGPVTMVDEVTAALTDAGVAADFVARELFGTGTAPVERPSTAAATATITLAGRSSTVEVEAGQSLLEAARTQRSDVPWSCTAGVCATCRAKLVEGEVDPGVIHGLTPAERAAGFVLTCQARPLSEHVAVDYDA